MNREYERNGERYQLLRWAQTAFRDLRVVPPGTGIIHQVNLEFLATVVTERADEDGTGRLPGHARRHRFAHDDDQRAGRPRATASAGSRPRPSCSASRSTSRCRGSSACACTGELPQGSTATDLVLVVTEMLRSYGVVGAFVEFAGDGLAGLSLADRATISNMSPEFGATATLFPIDDETLAYLRLTGAFRRTGRARRALRQGPRGCGASPGHGPDFDAALTLDLARSSHRSPGRAARRTASSCRRLPANFHAAFPQAVALSTARGAPTTVTLGDGLGDRGPRARSPSPRSPPAPTRRTRPSWSAPGCSRGTRWHVGCASRRSSRPRSPRARGP